MKHLDLFSGIGGFALAARWMGWQTVQFVEIDTFCQKVLNKNFPNTPTHGDIKTFDGTPYRGTIDILTGGFPCQPFSSAGKRKGKEDDRYLWPEMLRVIGEIQPTYIVGENVGGLVNWSAGLVFEQVHTDLEDKGYEIQSFILPACAVNAPHRRDRIWFIAHACSQGIRATTERIDSPRQLFQTPEWKESKLVNQCAGYSWTSTNSDKSRLPIRVQSRKRCNVKANGTFTQSQFTRTFATQKWGEFPTQSGICRGNDGLSNRVDRIKGLGNAIVPQVAFEIFKAIEATQRM